MIEVRAMDLSMNYHRAALATFISAALHIVVILLTGSEHLTSMIAGVVIWTLIGLGLMRQMRLVAYLGFLMGLLGVIVSLGFGMSAFGAERYAFLGITLFDLLAVIFLFGILWRTPQKA